MRADFVWNVMKGMVIGICNIAPGVSGSALSISMGVYDKILGAISGFPKDPKGSLKTLWPFALGMASGVLVLSFLLEFLFDRWPFQMNLMFTGLVAGCMPVIWKRVKRCPFRPSYCLPFFVLFAIVLLPVFSGRVNGQNAIFEISTLMIVKMVSIGILAAATLMIPGISGTLLLGVMGYYVPLLKEINGAVEAVFRLDFPALFSHLFYLIPFGTGVLTGAYVIARLMEFLLHRHQGWTYWGIFGVVLSSPLAMVLSMRGNKPSLSAVLGGLVLFFAGAWVSGRLSEEKKEVPSSTAG